MLKFSRINKSSGLLYFSAEKLERHFEGNLSQYLWLPFKKCRRVAHYTNEVPSPMEAM